MQFHSVTGKGHAMIQGSSEMRILMAFWAQALKNRPPQPQGSGADSEYVEIDRDLQSMQFAEGPL